MKTSLFLAVLMLVGCGGSGDCVQRSGTGTLRFTARSGNCGAIPEVVAEAQPSAPKSPCTGTVVHSADNCSMTVDQTCPGASGSTVTQEGTANFNQAGTSGTGVFEISVTSSGASCFGTYDATFTKI
jgi:hypothetical protein